MRLHYIRYDLKHGFQKIKTRTALVLSTITLAIAGTGGLTAAVLGSAHAATPSWRLNPSPITFNCSSTDYAHTFDTLNEDQFTGNFTGTGHFLADPSYTWNATGNVSGSNVTLHVVYTGTNAGYVLNGTGTIAADGSVRGTVDSNCQNFSMPAGSATAFTASSQVVVTPANVQGWSTADTRPGGTVTYVADDTAPGSPNKGALSLTTDATTTSKAQYLHAANTPLSQVNDLSYYTKQNTIPSFAQGDPSYQLSTCLGGIVNGGCVGFTTFVYEPYQNGTVTPATWQSWDVSAGHMWSSRSVTEGTCSVTAGGGGAPFYTLAGLKAACPDAVVSGFGVNIGSNNPSYNVESDLVDFNGTVYNFEPAPASVTLTNKDECKNNGWAHSTNPTFKNQGDCVSFFATKGKNAPSGGTAAHFAYGSVTLSNPTQELNFALNDNGVSSSDTGTVLYTNTSPALTYAANVTCVNVSGNTAYFAYQIPSDAPVAANVWVVWKVVDNGTTDTAGFTTAADQASANALCEAGNATVGNYTIVAGDIKVQ